MSGMGNMEHNDLCVGIDLGTTNSVLATINEKPNGEIVSKVVDIARATDIYNSMGGEAKLSNMKRPILPSCVYYRQEKNYEPLVGDYARMQYPLRPHLTAKSIKSQMGSPTAHGLSPDIPDKSPAQIASRILKHMLKEASKVYRCDITDAVITVPANFDSAMCKATLDAARLAGIQVEDSDGKERPVLLSEPNAVIYDLINQIHNGEISSRILDLSEKKRVLVFDLGGGTLDITMHEIKRRDGIDNVLKVDEIATNRYTLLGGDDFDEIIAQAMYERYLKQYAKHPDVVAKLRQNENIIMPQLRVYAEHLKLDVNEQYGNDYSSGWDDEEEGEFAVGGSMGGSGYAYDDTFTRNEIESILEKLMGTELVFSDYKRIDKITDTRNIIYPILDVLYKTREKLGGTDAAVDAVIVNGGMSKFYMVTERLKEFFGFEPITVLDPDQAVARGAAVYHYYLHKYEQIQDDMRLVGDTDAGQTGTGYGKDGQKQAGLVSRNPAACVSPMAIQWGKSILNDSLYLGVKNGAVHKIIPTGAQLPYLSPVMTGFRIEPGQKTIAIPIKSRNLDGSYRTIANGNISFKKWYADGAFVAFMVHMGSNKVIAMKAWTSKDENGNEKIEEGYVEIAIDNGEQTRVKTKFIAPEGSILEPKAEVNNLLQLCQNYERYKDKHVRNNAAKRISECMSSICGAGNREAFAEAVLDGLENAGGDEFRMRMFVIARRIGEGWNDSQKKRLSRICMNQLSPALHGLPARGMKVSVNIQAIYALSICGNGGQLAELSKLHKTSQYLQACLYTHGKTRTEMEWLRDELNRDIKRASKGMDRNLQFSSYAMGIALRRDDKGSPFVDPQIETITAKDLCGVIKTGKLNDEELICCILALGYICDQRQRPSEMDFTVFLRALDTVKEIDHYYPALTVLKCEKAGGVAVKMMNGETLSGEEERFLLVKLGE